MIKEEYFKEETIDNNGNPFITIKRKVVNEPEVTYVRRPTKCNEAKCVGCCSISDMKYIAKFNRSPYECPFYKSETKNDYSKIIKLCEFAKEATNKDDEYSAGMRAAFDYVIKCLEEGCIK